MRWRAEGLQDRHGGLQHNMLILSISGDENIRREPAAAAPNDFVILTSSKSRYSTRPCRFPAPPRRAAMRRGACAKIRLGMEARLQARRQELRGVRQDRVATAPSMLATTPAFASIRAASAAANARRAGSLHDDFVARSRIAAIGWRTPRRDRAVRLSHRHDQLRAALHARLVPDAAVAGERLGPRRVRPRARHPEHPVGRRSAVRRHAGRSLRRRPRAVRRRDPLRHRSRP